jgi:DNA-binding MarR family transcriptional regulator
MPTFDLAADPPDARIVTALARIGLALRTQAWRAAETSGLTPTQGQILALLRAHSDGMRLGAIATALAVTAQTASSAVATLVAKKLVRKRPDRDDSRALALTLTPEGARGADAAARWPDFLHATIATLSEAEQASFLRALMKIVRGLQIRGQIPVARICVTCRFFRPHVHADPAAPHHCAFVDAAFGDRSLRFDCADHAPAGKQPAAAAWRKFAAA